MTQEAKKESGVPKRPSEPVVDKWSWPPSSPTGTVEEKACQQRMQEAPEEEEDEKRWDELEEGLEKKGGTTRTAREKITNLIADRFLPEIIKRSVESGLEAVLNPESGLKRMLPDLKIRREVATYLLKQIDETKNLALRVIASEVRSFLENTNIEEAIKRILTSMAFEIRTNVRFVLTETGEIKPSVEPTVTHLEKQQRRRPPRRKEQVEGEESSEE